MPKFSKDKEALLKTLARFDRHNLVDDVTDCCDEPKIETSNHTFLLHVLLEALCGMLEHDEEKRLHLFNGVYSLLAKTRILNEQIVLDDLMPTRREMAYKFLTIVKEIHTTVTPSPAQDFPYIEFMNTSDSPKHPNKYEQTFEELKVIATGGFGTVCMAKHKFDGMIYAVKKIIFKYRCDDDYIKVIREVKSIATLNHLNVVSYNNAWIEDFDPSKHANLLDDIQSGTQSDESDSEDSCQSQTWNRNRRSNQKPRCANALSFNTDTSGSSSSYCRSSNLKQPNLLEDILFPKLKEPSLSQGLFGEILKNKFLKSSHQSKSSSSEWTERSNSSLKRKYFSSTQSDFECSQKSSLLCAASLEFKSMSLKVVLCIQMEYCDCDLRLWLDQRAKDEPLPFQMEEIDIFKDILNGVAHIHSKSIIHRDLKPQNIFFSTKDNCMKIGDFGLATLGSSSPNRQKEYSSYYSSDLGTLPYAAPEQRNRHNYDNKVDIYSLGIILIELLLQFQTQMEFSKSIDNIVHGNPPTELLTNWSDYVCLVENLVQKNPTHRMSAKEIINLPLIQGKDNHGMDNRQLSSEIKELKDALEEKEKLIKRLRQKIKEQACIIAEQKQQIELQCNASS